MQKKVAVLTDDDVLYSKIRLLLRNTADVKRVRSADECYGFDAVFADIDMAAGEHCRSRTGAAGENGDGVQMPGKENNRTGAIGKNGDGGQAYGKKIIHFVSAESDGVHTFSNLITMSRHGGADISLPFRHEEILDRMLGVKTADTLDFDSDGRHVYLSGEKIKLSEMEYRLLAVLAESDKEYMSREELLARVWGDGFDSGVVNVYIHYIRTKLETDGKKIILSSRKEGYGIAEKYRRKKIC